MGFPVRFAPTGMAGSESCLREFACELTSSLPPAREDGRSRAAVRGRDPGDPGNPRMGSFLQVSIAKNDGLWFGPAPLSSKTQLVVRHVLASRSFVASDS